MLAICEWALQFLKKGSNKSVFTDFGTKKIETPRNVNTVFKLAVKLSVCSFKAQGGDLRNRKKFDLLTEDGKTQFFSILLSILFTVKY